MEELVKIMDMLRQHPELLDKIKEFSRMREEMLSLTGQAMLENGVENHS